MVDDGGHKRARRPLQSRPTSSPSLRRRRRRRLRADDGHAVVSSPRVHRRFTTVPPPPPPRSLSRSPAVTLVAPTDTEILHRVAAYRRTQSCTLRASLDVMPAIALFLKRGCKHATTRFSGVTPTGVDRPTRHPPRRRAPQRFVVFFSYNGNRQRASVVSLTFGPRHWLQNASKKHPPKCGRHNGGHKEDGAAKALGD